MNNITVYDFATFDLIEKGEDWEGTQLLKDGVGSVKTVMGMDMLVTIQHNLIKENEWFGFADPAFMGKHIIFREPAVTVEVKGDHVSVYANAYDGLTFANPNSICIAHFVN